MSGSNRGMDQMKGNVPINSVSTTGVDLDELNPNFWKSLQPPLWFKIFDLFWGNAEQLRW